MKTCTPLLAAMLLASCGDPAPTAENITLDEMPASTAETSPQPAMSLVNTTWEWSDNGKAMVVSVDEAGGYIVEFDDGTHVDHGTYAQKDGKDCFTSAMDDKQSMCSSASPETAVGSTATSIDDKGLPTVYKRVAYRALKLPG